MKDLYGGEFDQWEMDSDLTDVTEMFAQDMAYTFQAIRDNEREKWAAFIQGMLDDPGLEWLANAREALQHVHSKMTTED